ncbi:hypothetical protein KFL_006190090 [Klebsormidium nitens]|uniref:Uncharacterized protein n=1 Tax=Klebsormidium nitens TaxID=105231 RepID=A0A1Y1ILE3_KLENI|nr:hypothetical protein KFL_006190090 [Klebsormidium nitens]|eukprot:GAQ90259.1 hypothetical protein KFL_006190090 [Klebsormidium nitens]
MSEDSPLPSQMNVEDALKLFGVAENASFDEIIKVRRDLVARFEGDMEKLAEVDEAYDILLMKSFSRRKAGQVSEEGIRFADVRKARPANLTPAWLKSALSKVAVSVETPDSKTLATEAAVFGVLAAWTFAGGLAQGGDLTPVSSGGDVPGLQLALALGAAFYFLQKERVKAVKAGLITVGGMATGSIVGGLIEAWLRVDIVPVLGIDSPAVVVSEFVLVALFLTTAYVR